jgi:hypothetical protein
MMLGREVRMPSEVVFGSRTKCGRPIVDYGSYIESLRELTVLHRNTLSVQMKGKDISII